MLQSFEFVNMLASKRRMELRSSWKCMSCFVGLADSTVLEVDFTPQSDGLEILTKARSKYDRRHHSFRVKYASTVGEVRPR